MKGQKTDNSIIVMDFGKKNVICFFFIMLTVVIYVIWQMYNIGLCGEGEFTREHVMQRAVLLTELFYIMTFFKIQCKKNRVVTFIIKTVLVTINVMAVEWIVRNIGYAGVEMTKDLKNITLVLILAAILFLYGICGRMYIAFIVADAVFVVFALVNYFVMMYRAFPVVPVDIFSTGTLSTVMGSYTIEFTVAQVNMICWIMAFIFVSMKIENWASVRRKEKFLWKLPRIALGSVGVILILNVCNWQKLETYGATVNQWDRTAGYYTNGPILNFMVNIKYASIEVPDNYSKKRALEILSEYNTEEIEKGKNANIIMIMNESLADFSLWEDANLTFNRDALPFIHSLSENTIKGRCYVSVFGASTCNSELEALTGHTMAFFPTGSVVYQLYPQEKTTCIIDDLHKNDYTCIAMHPFEGGNWNRYTVYDSMGFDEYYTKKDFEDPEYVRWISDKATYDKIIEIYESKEKDEKLFIFDVTMQGHGAYTTGANWAYPVEAKDEDFPEAREAMSSTYVSDEAFKYLVEYFANEDEPTVICMFGDHQPAVEEEFFDKMYGTSNISTLEEMQKKYVTPYIIWANYDFSGENKDISANYLRCMVKDIADVDTGLTSYEAFLREFSEKIPVINANGYLGNDGVWHEFTEKNKYSSLIEDYSIVQYYLYCDYR